MWSSWQGGVSLAGGGLPGRRGGGGVSQHALRHEADPPPVDRHAPVKT